jgi:hypothetical protein
MTPDQKAWLIYCGVVLGIQAILAAFYLTIGMKWYHKLTGHNPWTGEHDET